MTQWPRWQVFEQEAEGKPHSLAGSVHAPDAEMALLAARDVFSRRPRVISLWCVREDQVQIRSAAEIAALSTDTTGEVEQYHVFIKTDHKGVHQHAGDIEGPSADAVIRRAAEQFSDKPGLDFMVCPARAMLRSTAEDIEGMLLTEQGKSFRYQGEYMGTEVLRKIMGGTLPKEIVDNE